jgi:ribonuclease PH
VVVDRGQRLYPPAVMPWLDALADASGNVGSRPQLVVARPSRDDDELWAIDQALRCPGVAAVLACRKLVEDRKLPRLPIRQLVGAVSVGIVGGVPLLDLDYPEDRDAEVDMNLVVTEGGHYVEVQSSGEEAVFSPEQFDALLSLGRAGTAQIIAAQRLALGLPADGAAVL